MLGDSIAAVPSEQVRSDLDTVVSTHDLSGRERERLIRIVTGAVPGNRDKPLHALAVAIHKLAEDQGEAFRACGLFDLLELALKQEAGSRLGRISGALLDFLATMDNAQHFDEIETAVRVLCSDQGAKDGIAPARSAFASALHAYRVKFLPYERRRQAFESLRKFFHAARPGTGLPEDGDAVSFWCSEATSERWTMYSATLRAVLDFTEAAGVSRELAAPKSLDALTDLGFECSPETYGDDSLEELNLSGAVKALKEAQIKVFTGVQIDEIERFDMLGATAGRWCVSGLAHLCYTPVQGSLTQLLRANASSERIEIAASCDESPSYIEKIAHLEELNAICDSVLEFARFLVEHQTEKGSALSTADMSLNSRVRKMLRRKSFAGRSQNEVLNDLAQIAPAVAIVRQRLNSVLRQWSSAGFERLDALGKQDQVRFSSKLAQLYCGAER